MRREALTFQCFPLEIEKEETEGELRGLRLVLEETKERLAVATAKLAASEREREEARESVAELQGKVGNMIIPNPLSALFLCLPFLC